MQRQRASGITSRRTPADALKWQSHAQRTLCSKVPSTFKRCVIPRSSGPITTGSWRPMDSLKPALQQINTFQPDVVRSQNSVHAGVQEFMTVMKRFDRTPQAGEFVMTMLQTGIKQMHVAHQLLEWMSAAGDCQTYSKSIGFSSLQHDPRALEAIRNSPNPRAAFAPMTTWLTNGLLEKNNAMAPKRRAAPPVRGGVALVEDSGDEGEEQEAAEPRGVILQADSEDEEEIQQRPLAKRLAAAKGKPKAKSAAVAPQRPAPQGDTLPTGAVSLTMFADFQTEMRSDDVQSDDHAGALVCVCLFIVFFLVTLQRHTFGILQATSSASSSSRSKVQPRDAATEEHSKREDDGEGEAEQAVVPVSQPHSQKRSRRDAEVAEEEDAEEEPTQNSQKRNRKHKRE